VETKIILFVYNIMKGGNTDSKAPEIQGFDYDGVERYGTVNMTGGKGKGKGKSKSTKFSDFDFEKEWKEFEESYNQKYGGASKKKKTSSSTKKKPAKKTSSAKKPAKKASSAKKPKRKTQRGGDEAGATFAPAQFFDEKATMSAPPSGPVQTAYGLSNPVDGPDRNLAPSPNSTGIQTGGAKKKSSKTKKPKTATKTTKPKKDSKKKDTKKDSKKESKKDSKKKDTKTTGKKVSVLDKIKKFFAM